MNVKGLSTGVQWRKWGKDIEIEVYTYLNMKTA
jgi:hypothetical protein